MHGMAAAHNKHTHFPTAIHNSHFHCFSWVKKSQVISLALRSQQGSHLETPSHCVPGRMLTLQKPAGPGISSGSKVVGEVRFMEKYRKKGGPAPSLLLFGRGLPRAPARGRGATHSEGLASQLIKPTGWFSNLDNFCSLAPISRLKPSLRAVLILTPDWGESRGNGRYQTLSGLVFLIYFCQVDTTEQCSPQLVLELHGVNLLDLLRWKNCPATSPYSQC